MAEKQVRVTQRRSVIGCNVRQKATVRALGLKRINHSVVHGDKPEIRGMIARVEHIVQVTEL